MWMDAGVGEGLGAGDAEGARGGEVFHLADHRGLDTLAGAEQVDRLLREVAGGSPARSNDGAVNTPCGAIRRATPPAGCPFTVIWRLAAVPRRCLHIEHP